MPQARLAGVSIRRPPEVGEWIRSGVRTKRPQSAVVAQTPGAQACQCLQFPEVSSWSSVGRLMPGVWIARCSASGSIYSLVKIYQLVKSLEQSLCQLLAAALVPQWCDDSRTPTPYISNPIPGPPTHRRSPSSCQPVNHRAHRASPQAITLTERARHPPGSPEPFRPVWV